MGQKNNQSGNFTLGEQAELEDIWSQVPKYMDMKHKEQIEKEK